MTIHPHRELPRAPTPPRKSRSRNSPFAALAVAVMLTIGLIAFVYHPNQRPGSLGGYHDHWPGNSRTRDRANRGFRPVSRKTPEREQTGQ